MSGEWQVVDVYLPEENDVTVKFDVGDGTVYSNTYTQQDVQYTTRMLSDAVRALRKIKGVRHGDVRICLPWRHYLQILWTCGSNADGVCTYQNEIDYMGVVITEPEGNPPWLKRS